MTARFRIALAAAYACIAGCALPQAQAPSAFVTTSSADGKRPGSKIAVLRKTAAKVGRRKLSAVVAS